MSDEDNRRRFIATAYSTLMLMQKATDLAVKKYPHRWVSRMVSMAAGCIIGAEVNNMEPPSAEDMALLSITSEEEQPTSDRIEIDRRVVAWKDAIEKAKKILAELKN